MNLSNTTLTKNSTEYCNLSIYKIPDFQKQNGLQAVTEQPETPGLGF